MMHEETTKKSISVYRKKMDEFEKKIAELNKAKELGVEISA